MFILHVTAVSRTAVTMEGRAIRRTASSGIWRRRRRESVHPWQAGIGEGVGEHGVLWVMGVPLLCRTAIFWCNVWAASVGSWVLRVNLQGWHGR